MKEILIKVVTIFLLLTIIVYIDFPHIKDNISFTKTKKSEKKNIEVSININGKIIKKNLDDYLVGVVAGEMPAEFEEEALKTQVVASRTFVLSRKLKVDNTTNSQVYLTESQMKKSWGKDYQKFRNKLEKAVKETNNEVMMYNGKYISALFFSSSNGKTNNCGDYFTGGDIAYLKSVDSHWDLTIDKTNKRKKSFSKKELADIFHTNVNKFQIMSYTNSGYVKSVVVNNKEYSGRKIRELLNLASSSFQIHFSKDKYTFITLGNGHGVGMSQYGAQGMAKENKNYKEILNHYYKNIEIKSIES